MSISQRWSSYSEALEQCRLVEVRAAAVCQPKRSASGPLKRIFAVEECDEILRKHGALPLTAAERKKYAKCLQG